MIEKNTLKQRLASEAKLKDGMAGKTAKKAGIYKGKSKAIGYSGVAMPPKAKNLKPARGK